MEKKSWKFAVGDCVRLLYVRDELFGRIVQLVGEHHALVAWYNLSSALHSTEMLEHADRATVPAALHTQVPADG